MSVAGSIDWLNGCGSAWAVVMRHALVESVPVLLAICAVSAIGRRIPARFRYGIWWLGCAKLILSVVMPATIDLPVLPTSETPPAMHRAIEALQFAPIVASQHPRFGQPTSKAMSIPAVPDNTNPILSRQPGPNAAAILMLLWLAGVSILTLGAVRRCGRTREIVRNATPVTDSTMLREAAEISARLHVRVPCILESPRASGLCVVGFLRPIILTPVGWSASACCTDPDGRLTPAREAEMPPTGSRPTRNTSTTLLTQQERSIALTHEFAHIKRGDLRMELVPAVTRIVWFFNPLAWLAADQCSALREEACDAMSLSLTQCGAGAYAAMLMKAVVQSRNSMQGAMGLSPGFRDLRARMTALGRIDTGRSVPGRTAGTVTLGALVVTLAPWQCVARIPRVVPIIPSLAGYTLVDLGPISGDTASQYRLNDAGDVVGTSGARPLLWQRGQPRLLGTLWYPYGRGGGINDNGEYVVTSYSEAGNPHAYYSGSASPDLNSVGSTASDRPRLVKGVPGYRFTVARGINNGGWIAGSAQRRGQYRRGVEESRPIAVVGGRTIDLGTLGGDYGASYAVNDANQVVGKADLATEGTPVTHAFIWNTGSMTDLGTLGGSNSCAYAINIAGEAAGFALTTGDNAHHACLWPIDSQPVDLGTLPGDQSSEAHGINDDGQVVGTSDQSPDSRANRAVLWDGSTPIDLNSRIFGKSGWLLQDAMSINNRGVIVGKGLCEGVEHAFILVPSSPAKQSPAVLAAKR